MSSPQNLAFVLSRDRDAAAIIRGFVLQVDGTIAAWLDLGEADLLELECGEDIDHIAGAARTLLGAPDRLLEQIKQRKARLTLLSAEAGEALANFFLHRQNNPDRTLRFRFTTTAAVARERRSALPAGLPAILAWEEVRCGRAPAAEEAALLEALRTMVGRVEKPANIPAPQWAAFQHFVATAAVDVWREFVVGVEWSTAAPDSNSLRPAIRARLQREFGMGTAAEADAAYQHLFAVVFDHLATKGRPRLSRAALLDELRRRPGSAERARVAELAILHAALAEQVEAVDQRVEGLSEVVAATMAQVAGLAAGASITALIDPRAVAAPPIAAPVATAHSSPRLTTVRDLLPTDGHPHVLALTGATSSGKTQLARLVAEQLGTRPLWVRLAGLDTREAAGRLAQAVDTALAAAGDPRRATPDWDRRILAVPGIAGVVVLDDVPVFREGDELGARLLPLINACVTGDRSVVVTGTVALEGLRRALSVDVLVARPIPPFTAEEVRDVLTAYGAPPAALGDPTVRVLEAITAGHPVLLHAAARYLQARDWVLDDALEGLFRQHYAAPTNRDTVRTLLGEIADGATRELLYRLTLTGVRFREPEFTALAAVSPAIPTARERLITLIGPWLQPTDQGGYELSPLVRILGADDLAPPVRRNCHRVLAEQIATRRRIGEGEFSLAISHFVGAEDYDTAGLLLLRGLHAIYLNPPPGRSLILSLWADLQLPTAMSPRIRVMVLAYQAMLAHRAGRPYAAYLTEASALLEALAAAPALAQVGPAVFIAMSIGLDDAVGAAPFLRHALTRWPEVEGQLTGALQAEGKLLPDISGLAWICSGGVRDDAGLVAWTTAVAGLPPPMRARVFQSPLGVHGADIVAELVLRRQYKALPEHRDWPGAAAVLERLEAAARDMGAIPLVAAARAARISAVIEATRDAAAGMALADPALVEFAAAPDATFLVAKAVGFGGMFTGQSDLAADWLQRADACPGDAHALTRVDVALRLAEVLSASDPAQALAAVERAVTVARHAPVSFLPPELDAGELPSAGRKVLAKALGELTLARWAVGDRSGAAAAWLEAVDALLAARDDSDPLWRGLFVVMGHVSGYLTALATTGHPPAQTAEGTPYVAPQQGMLVDPRPEVADRFRPDLTAFIRIHAMQLADAIGDPAAAVRWAREAVERLQELRLWTAAVIPLRRLVEHAILEDDYAAAIDWATDVAAAHWVMRDAPRDPEVLFAPGAPPRERIGPRTEADWTDIDGLVIGQAVLPAFLRVAAATPERIPALATALRDACADEAAASPESPVWPIAADLCQETFLGEADARALRTRANELRNKGDAFRSLAAMAQLGASVAPGFPPAQRLAWQLGLVEYLEQHVGRDGVLYEPVFVAFFVTFWQKVFADGRFYFQAPGLVATQLTELLGLAPAQRVRRLIRVVASALGVTPPPSVRSWLDAA